MKIYTKTGDAGETGLLGGRRVPKEDLILHAYGTVDELNGWLGLVRAEKLDGETDARLARVQGELFELGSDLASPANEPMPRTVRPVDPEAAKRLEEEIDAETSKLPPLTNFILPGGVRSAALLHLARTVCRRAERYVAQAVREGRARKETLVYLNRLSDWLFVLARATAKRAGGSDVVWRPPK